MSLDRDYRNYGGQTTADYDPQAKRTFNIFEIAARFILTTQTLQLTFEGWKSTQDFDRRRKPQPIYRRDFQLWGDDFPAVRNDFSEIFESLEQSAVSFLDVSDEDYEFESLTINANEKRIIVAAKHKTKERRISEQINTEEGFDQTLLDHPELVSAYFTFVWSYGKASDDFLASLNPAV
jgi:hypothetical protein